MVRCWVCREQIYGGGFVYDSSRGAFVHRGECAREYYMKYYGEAIGDGAD
jgi:hypothetical protein